MPIYVFKCDGCKKITEKILPVGRNIKKCPECGEKKLQKVIQCPVYIDTHSPMHPRRGRGRGGAGRIDPGQGTDFGQNFG